MDAKWSQFVAGNTRYQQGQYPLHLRWNEEPGKVAGGTFPPTFPPFSLQQLMLSGDLRISPELCFSEDRILAVVPRISCPNESYRQWMKQLDVLLLCVTGFLCVFDTSWVQEQNTFWTCHRLPAFLGCFGLSGWEFQNLESWVVESPAEALANPPHGWHAFPLPRKIARKAGHEVRYNCISNSAKVVHCWHCGDTGSQNQTNTAIQVTWMEHLHSIYLHFPPKDSLSIAMRSSLYKICFHIFQQISTIKSNA